MDQEVTMNFNKLRQCYKFISFKSLHQSSYVIPKPFIYDKFLKIASYSIFFHGNLQKTFKKEPVSLLTIP